MMPSTPRRMPSSRISLWAPGPLAGPSRKSTEMPRQRAASTAPSRMLWKYVMGAERRARNTRASCSPKAAAAPSPPPASSTSHRIHRGPLLVDLHALDAVSEGVQEVVRLHRGAHRVQHLLEQADLMCQPRLLVIEPVPLQRGPGGVQEHLERRAALALRRLEGRLLQGEVACRRSPDDDGRDQHPRVGGHGPLHRHRERQVRFIPCMCTDNAHPAHRLWRRARGARAALAGEARFGREAHPLPSERVEPLERPVDEAVPFAEEQVPRDARGAIAMARRTICCNVAKRSTSWRIRVPLIRRHDARRDGPESAITHSSVKVDLPISPGVRAGSRPADGGQGRRGARRVVAEVASRPRGARYSQGRMRSTRIEVFVLPGAAKATLPSGNATKFW